MEDSFAKLSAAAFISAEYERSLSDIKIQCETLRAENAALRAVVKEMERIVSLVGMIDGQANGWEWQLIKEHVESLQSALDKINETGQHV